MSATGRGDGEIRRQSTYKLYTHASPLAAQREHDGLAPLHLTCHQVSFSLLAHGHAVSGVARSTPTLRLRQASHEKALFRASVGLEGTSAISDEPSTTIGQGAWGVMLVPH
jgi:hypothetical protein